MENFLTRKFGSETSILQGYKQNQKENAPSSSHENSSELKVLEYPRKLKI